MKKHAFYCLIVGLTALVFGLSSCYETPDYSTTPEISFNSITKFTVADAFSGPTAKRDSVVITLDYKDGDGDLGEVAGGRDNPKYYDWGNYELRTFRKEANGSFKEIILPENRNLFFPELVKNSKATNRKSVIEGTLDYGSYFNYSKQTKLSVVKFQIRIRDRALNVSNMIETDTISVPTRP
jgi:hypothetical protein